MTSKSKTAAEEPVRKWLTRPEALELIMAHRGCSLEEAEKMLAEFREEEPDGWRTVSLN